MELEKRISAFKKMLFNGYERGDKITEQDWHDEATRLALMIKEPEDISVIGNKISTYLEDTFPDDGYKNFNMLGLKMAETIHPYL